MLLSMGVFTCNIMKLNHDKYWFLGLYLAHIITVKEIMNKVCISTRLFYYYLDCFFFLSVHSVIYLVSYA